MQAHFARLGALLLAGATLTGCGDSDQFAFTGASTSPLTVSRTERVWVDGSRVTPRTSKFPGAPDRTLRVLIWQPSRPDPSPLLVMAHGFGGLPEKFDAFARTVAAAGYVVAAPAFPLTNENAPGGHDVGLRDQINQPADVSFVITQLLNAAATAGDPLAARIQPSEIAALGHSLGGATVIGLTRKNCCRDDRVRATVLVAAATFLATALGSDPITAGPPTLVIHGTGDQTVAYESSVDLYSRIAPPRILLGLTGAGHSEAVESQIDPPIAARAAAQRATIAFLNAMFRGAQATLDTVLADLANDGNPLAVDWGR
jgi:dienelactone hydrolase